MNSIINAYLDEETHPFYSKTAIFEGLLEVPQIKANDKLIIPKHIVPLSKAKYCDKDFLADSFIAFYESDSLFKDFLKHPKKYFPILRKAKGIIAPDCSLYFDDPFFINMIAVYMRNSIAHFLQENGFYVIANPRWGNEKTYTTAILPEEIAFLGCPQNTIVAIGSFGAIQEIEEKEHFVAGLRIMLKKLTPKIVLVYGAMPSKIFDEFKKCTQFIQYDEWTKIVKRGK